MAFRWRADIGPTLNAVIFQGIWTSIAKESYNFVIFQRGSGPQCPSLWIGAWILLLKTHSPLYTSQALLLRYSGRVLLNHLSKSPPTTLYWPIRGILTLGHFSLCLRPCTARCPTMVELYSILSKKLIVQFQQLVIPPNITVGSILMSLHAVTS